MDFMFLCVVIFLFVLAVFDLSVGVSNDAVNFLNSALGSKAAPFKRIIIVASLGVFIGAAMSNGMMDIARHGIFRPEHFSFYDLTCIFMAVMVTDIILLDIFNTLGMPTSTTVSMVFELLGATFVVALFKMASGTDLGFSDLLNTSKALSVILGIFLSVAIAFVFGTVVQFITRLIFAFDYRSSLKWKIGIFGGICATAIVYFLIVKGARDLTFMTPAVKTWIDTHTALILIGCLLFFTVLMQTLHALKVNVLKVIVLMGTFALAMAFAGNDLVNFIGVPLSGLASYTDYTANGAGDPHSFMMSSLLGPSDTHIGFLIGAGAVMVVSLAGSKKARRVAQTEIGLGSQHAGDEMFGSSRIARLLVRRVLAITLWIKSHLPARMRRGMAVRFDNTKSQAAEGAAFDLVRGSVNLVLAGALIALGTSLRLPLSTTFVTFMVAMGTSLADRAWGRESAVFRITGVISVIGGWFITAGAAFIGAGIIVALMHLGGQWVMLALAVLTLVIIIRSNRRFKQRKAADNGDDALFRAILDTNDSATARTLLLRYINGRQLDFISFATDSYGSLTHAFAADDARTLARTERLLARRKDILKNTRRKETLCLSRIDRATVLEKNAWFYLANNCCMGILYNLRRIAETCREHVDNNFRPLPRECVDELGILAPQLLAYMADVHAALDNPDSISPDTLNALRRRADHLKENISTRYHALHTRLHFADPADQTVLYVYLNLLHESRELVSTLRKYLRAAGKLFLTGQSVEAV